MSYLGCTRRVQPAAARRVIVTETDNADSKWVTDDYYEDEALAKCAENGFTPYGPALKADIDRDADAHMAPQGRAPAGGGADRLLAGLGHAESANRISHISLAPFYTIGGPSTTFAGSGEDPWASAGWGNKRMRLKSMGVRDDDWMWRLAKESREVDAQLLAYREERLPELEGKDLDVWAWKEEEEDLKVAVGKALNGAGVDGKDAFGAVVGTDPTRRGSTPPLPNKDDTAAASVGAPPMDRKRSALGQEVTFAPSSRAGTAEGETAPNTGHSSPLTEPSGPSGPSRHRAIAATPVPPVEVEKTPGGKIVIESEKSNRGVGSWSAGVVRAVIEACSILHQVANLHPCDRRSFHGSDADVSATYTYTSCTSTHPTFHLPTHSLVPSPDFAEQKRRIAELSRPNTDRRPRCPRAG